MKERASAQAALASIMGQRQVDPGQFRAVLGALDDAHAALRAALVRAKTIPLPPLPNVTAGDPLRPLLLTRNVVSGLDPDTNTLDGEWIGKFLGQLDEVLGKTARLLAKSLGGILARHEGIAEEYLRRGEADLCPAPVPARRSSRVRPLRPPLHRCGERVGVRGDELTAAGSVPR